jgi:hypothetical protein
MITKDDATRAKHFRMALSSRSCPEGLYELRCQAEDAIEDALEPGQMSKMRLGETSFFFQYRAHMVSTHPPQDA